MRHHAGGLDNQKPHSSKQTLETRLYGTHYGVSKCSVLFATHTLQLVRSLTPVFPYDPVCLAFILSLATALLLSAFFVAALLSWGDEAL